MDLSLRGSHRVFLRPITIFGTVSIALVALSGAAVSSGAVTTDSLLQATKAAIDTQPGVRVTFVANSGSPSPAEKIVADVGTKSGNETVSQGSSHITIRLTPTYAYVSGNSSGFINILGLSSAQATRIGTHWVSWKASTTQYSSFKSGLTISAVVALLPKAKGTAVSSKVSNGTTVYVLRWTDAATSSTPQLSVLLTVSAGSSPLPLVQTVTASGGRKATTTLSQWGEQVLVSAPPAASTMASSKIG
jgi:hypothetical protein